MSDPTKKEPTTPEPTPQTVPLDTLKKEREKARKEQEALNKRLAEIEKDRKAELAELERLRGGQSDAEKLQAQLAQFETELKEERALRQKRDLTDLRRNAAEGAGLPRAWGDRLMSSDADDLKNEAELLFTQGEELFKPKEPPPKKRNLPNITGMTGAAVQPTGVTQAQLNDDVWIADNPEKAAEAMAAGMVPNKDR